MTLQRLKPSMLEFGPPSIREQWKRTEQVKRMCGFFQKERIRYYQRRYYSFPFTAILKPKFNTKVPTILHSSHLTTN